MKITHRLVLGTDGVEVWVRNVNQYICEVVVLEDGTVLGTTTHGEIMEIDPYHLTTPLDNIMQKHRASHIIFDAAKGFKVMMKTLPRP